MSTSPEWFTEQAEKHEKEALDFRIKAEKVKECLETIKIGTVIKDLDTGVLMEVSRLQNGCVDFEAKPLSKEGVGRGYHYLVPNWELVSTNE